MFRLREPQCRCSADSRLPLSKRRSADLRLPLLGRTGATLTEVLMAILILGVGVVSVFTLFPISILRAIQATQNTNGKILKFSTEELVRSQPIVLDVNSPPVGTPAGIRFRGPWSPNTAYSSGDIVVPTVKPGSPLPAPHFWFQCVASTSPTNSNRGEPLWNLLGATVDVNEDLNGNGTLDMGEDANGNGALDQLAWTRVLPVNLASVTPGAFSPVPATALQVDATSGIPISPVDGTNSNDPVVSGSTYVVDPLGWAIAMTDGNMPINEFGNKTDNSTGVGTSLWAIAGGSNDLSDATLLRINGGLNDATAAALSTTLPDSWETVLGEDSVVTPVSVFNVDTSSSPAGPGIITVPGTIDLTGIGVGTIGTRRVVITSSDGTRTFTRDITGIGGSGGAAANEIRWSGQHPAPANFPVLTSGPPDELDVGRIRVEVFDRRYSWFLTVKKDASGRADIKVVVVFKRSLTAADEHCYDSNFGNYEVDIDGGGQEDGAEHGLGTLANPRRDWVKIVWNNSGTPEPEPLTKPGNFLFDARDCEWYRIREVYARDDTATPPYAVLILDRTVKTLTPPTPDGTVPDTAAPIGRTILMRGIIDVYDL